MAHSYGKPVINDECEYEGNIPRPWGNISAQELVHRFWIMVVNGGYAGHGETYMHPDDILWWGKGGVLHGESWKRIAFLRQIIEELPPGGLRRCRAVGSGRASRPVSSATPRLIYFGEHQPLQWAIGLPQGRRRVRDRHHRHVEHDHHTGASRAHCRSRRRPVATAEREAAFGVELPGKPYVAVRVRRVHQE